MDTSLALSDSHRLAHAFLALGDDDVPEPAQRPLSRRLTAVAAVLALAIAAPLSWMAPSPRSLTRSRPISPRPRWRARRPGSPRRPMTRTTASPSSAPGRETVGAVQTVAEAPPWARLRSRPTWGLEEGDAIAAGRTVLRRLGGGSRFEVFLVWDDHRLAVLVAKVLRPDLAEEPAAVRELAREAAMLAALGHPVVVRGFDAVTEGRFPHLLTEHLEGPTLQSLLERHGPLALEQLLPLGMHVAAALHYLSCERMVHLDVKPDNVVMGAPPRLIDFSVARTVAEAARTRRPVGTDAYMSPEQCGAGTAGAPAIGPASDVFGLGATLYHALAGRRPFPRAPGARDTGEAELRFPQLVRAPAPLPRRAPAPLAGLIAAMLAPVPADRPTAAEVAGALEPAVADLPRRRAR